MVLNVSHPLFGAFIRWQIGVDPKQMDCLFLLHTLDSIATQFQYKTYDLTQD